jgi:hypothetical protein
MRKAGQQMLSGLLHLEPFSVRHLTDGQGFLLFNDNLVYKLPAVRDYTHHVHAAYPA